MKKTLLVLSMVLLLSGCTHLTRQEEIELRQLSSQGITVDRPVGNYEKPATPVVAGALNILPGIGNFYLAMGNGGDSNHGIYGFLNLLFWPLSIVWSVPEAAIDATKINQREMLYYYKYDPQGKKDAAKHNIVFE